MYTTPSKSFTGLAFTARDPVASVQNGAQPLSPCPPSALKMSARRLEVAPASAIKDTSISFRSAIDHFSLMERVGILESERDRLREELKASNNVVVDLNKQLLERPMPAAAAAEDADDEGPGNPASMSRQELIEQVALLRGQLVKEQQARREAHNTLVDMRGNVRVYCRVRPPNAAGTSAVSLLQDKNSLSVTYNAQQYGFNFNHIYGPSTTQQAIFEDVSELVQSSLDGYHVCLFSYGQTGSGKTYNMTGLQSQEGRGIIPRAVDKILNEARRLQMQGWSHRIEACCLEIYNDKIRDLIPEGGEASGAHVKEICDMNAIKHNAEGGTHTHIVGVRRMVVSSTGQAMELLSTANTMRASNATAMNTSSSRSHCVFMLNISSHHAEQNTKTTGTLCLVDLAGSERLDRSKAEGARKLEACAINQSLSSLGDVLDALSSKSKHVPYRNSKLTYLLKPCLSPGGKVLMFVHAAPEPESAFETLTSLRFAVKVAGVEVGPAQRNMTVNGLSTGEIQQGLPAATNPGYLSHIHNIRLPGPTPAEGAVSSQAADAATGADRAASAATEAAPSRCTRSNHSVHDTVGSLGPAVAAVVAAAKPMASRARRAPGLETGRSNAKKESVDLRSFLRQTRSRQASGSDPTASLRVHAGKVVKKRKGGAWH